MTTERERLRDIRRPNLYLWIKCMREQLDVMDRYLETDNYEDARAAAAIVETYSHEMYRLLGMLLDENREA